MRKLVAIGGGEYGKYLPNGTRMPYELREIDQEIVRLTEKKAPKFLFLGHAQRTPELENVYFNAIRDVYEGIFGCQCKMLPKSMLEDMRNDRIDELIDWADIIHECGGNTKGMLDLWRSTGFDLTLRQAWESEKVICGVSAGAICWFRYCSTDALKAQINDPTAPMLDVDGLGFFDAYFSPHHNVAEKYSNRPQHMRESLKTLDTVGLGLSDCAALEIVGDGYRLLTTDASNYNIQAFGVKAFCKDGHCFEEKIEQTDKFKPLSELLSK